jgi:hypothetical protein
MALVLVRMRVARFTPWPSSVFRRDEIGQRSRRGPTLDPGFRRGTRILSQPKFAAPFAGVSQPPGSASIAGFVSGRTGPSH